MSHPAPQCLLTPSSQDEAGRAGHPHGQRSLEPLGGALRLMDVPGDVEGARRGFLLFRAPQMHAHSCLGLLRVT